MDRKKTLVIIVLVILASILIVSFLQLRSDDTKNIRLKLVIDHDGGADDAMAIFVAALYERYFNGPTLVALTTVFGNVDEEKVFINSQRILNIAGRRDVQIYRGSSDAILQSIQSDYYFGEDGLGDNEIEHFDAIKAENQHAAVALVELSKKYKGNLVIVAIGPLTNIALAIALDPNFITRLRHLYVAAGNIDAILDKMVPEFNAAMDVEAYQVVAKSRQQDKLTFIPFSQILNHQNITNDWRINVLGSIPTQTMHMQNKFESVNLKKSSYWSQLDPSATAIALNDTSVVETRYGVSSIEMCGSNRGITSYNVTEPKPTARIIYKLNKEPYMDFLYKLFSAETVKGHIN